MYDASRNYTFTHQSKVSYVLQTNFKICGDVWHSALSFLKIRQNAQERLRYAFVYQEYKRPHGTKVVLSDKQNLTLPWHTRKD